MTLATLPYITNYPRIIICVSTRNRAGLFKPSNLPIWQAPPKLKPLYNFIDRNLCNFKSQFLTSVNLHNHGEKYASSQKQGHFITEYSHE